MRVQLVEPQTIDAILGSIGLFFLAPLVICGWTMPIISAGTLGQRHSVEFAGAIQNALAIRRVSCGRAAHVCGKMVPRPDPLAFDRSVHQGRFYGWEIHRDQVAIMPHREEHHADHHWCGYTDDCTDGVANVAWIFKHEVGHEANHHRSEC